MSREPTAIEAGMALVQERLEAENAELRAEVERLREALESVPMGEYVHGEGKWACGWKGWEKFCNKRKKALATAPKEEA